MMGFFSLTEQKTIRLVIVYPNKQVNLLLFVFNAAV